VVKVATVTMPESFQPETLKKLVAKHVECDPAQLAFDIPSTGKHNATYLVNGACRPLVIRISPPDDAGYLFYERGMMAQEPNIHKLIRDRTNAPVAEIIAYDSSREVIDRDYLIMERLPGVPLTEASLTRRQLESVLQELGIHLKAIHAITAEQYGYLGKHKCMKPQKTWAEAFRVMWDRLIDDIEATGSYSSGEANWARSLLEKHYSVFDRPVISRLLHMDIWAQNILVDDYARLSGILDFDRALWGDKEIEFAVLDYCGISEPAFWHGYGEQRDLSPEAWIRRQFYLLYEVQKYMVIYYYRRSRQSDAINRYKQQSINMLSTL